MKKGFFVLFVLKTCIFRFDDYTTSEKPATVKTEPVVDNRPKKEEVVKPRTPAEAAEAAEKAKKDAIKNARTPAEAAEAAEKAKKDAI